MRDVLQRMWTERSSEESRRRLMVWVATGGAALASVPVASLVIGGYHLTGFRDVWLAALWPMLTTALCMRFFLRGTRRAAGLGLLFGPLLGLLNTGVMAGLFAYAEKGELAGALGTALTAAIFGFPVGLGVGMVFAVVLLPLLAYEQSLRGREDADAGLALEAFAAAWALVVAAVTFFLEAQRPPLSLAPRAVWPSAPAIAGWLALVGALALSAHTALRTWRLGRAMQRVAAGRVPGLRLVVANEEERARVPGAELTVVAEDGAGAGPFREGALHQRLGSFPSLRTLAWRTSWLVVAACSLAGVLHATRASAAPTVVTQAPVTPGACESFRCEEPTGSYRDERRQRAW